MAKEPKPLTDEDIAACEPESIWLETRKVPLPAHAVLWLILAVLACGAAWAAFAKVDRIVAAEGKLVTTRPNITLKPLENSLVKEVAVRPGQRVRKGDVLVSFDPTVNEAELAHQQAQYNAKLCEVLRLQAESAGAEALTLPGELAGTPAGREQAALFADRLAYHAGRTAYFSQYISRYRKMAESLERALAMYGQRQQNMERIEDMYRRLEERGTIPLKDALEVQMQRLSNEIEIENQKASLVEYRQMVRQCEAERDVFLADWKQQTGTSLVEARAALASYEDGVRKYTLLAAQTALYAPCDAVVHEVAPYQEGSGVREAEAMVTLIPAGVPLEAEIDIRPQDVGRLREGDTAKIKFDAFPFQQHGTLCGTLRYISADTHESRGNADQWEESASGAAPTATRPQYRSRLVLSGQLEGVPDSAWQSAGMKVRAEIKVGERSVLDYILNPFLKAMDESIREP